MGMLKYVIAVDQGSSGTMVALLDQHAQMLDYVDIPITVSTPCYGWVEHDPYELVDSIREGARQLISKHPELLPDIVGMGVANQGESFLLWDTVSGKPVTPVISWQDSRSEAYCKELQDKGYDKWFNSKTGLHLSSEWPALKIRRIREESPDLDKLCDSGTIAYGQLDAWFLYVLTGNKVIASDHGTACRSGLYNVSSLDWDVELIEFFGGDNIIFPKLVDNICHFEGVDLGIGKLLPWVAGGLDQSVALLGQLCIKPKAVKVTYGTCCSCWMNIGDKLVFDDKLTSSVAWKIGSDTVYGLAAEGGVAGSIITWLYRNFHAEWPVKKLSQIAYENDDQDSLIFVPAFNGLAAPYWETEAKGTLFGMTAGTKPEHILRAGLDSIAYTVKDILDTMPDSDVLIVDGGMTANEYLLHKQANVLGKPIIKNENKEGTITGIGFLICLSLGFIKSFDELQDRQKDAMVIIPDMDQVDNGYRTWKKAIDTVIAYYKREDRS